MMMNLQAIAGTSVTWNPTSQRGASPDREKCTGMQIHLLYHLLCSAPGHRRKLCKLKHSVVGVRLFVWSGVRVNQTPTVHTHSIEYFTFPRMCTDGIIINILHECTASTGGEKSFLSSYRCLAQRELCTDAARI